MVLKKIYRGTVKLCLGDWGYNLWIQRRSEQRDLLPHYSCEGLGKESEKSVVFVNNGWTWHAGLCDRLRAITTLYAWCKEHNERFKIHFVHPFELSEYIVPNEYDWKIDAEEICYNLHDAIPCRMMYGPDVEPLRLAGRLYPLVEQWMAENLKASKKQIHVYTNLFLADSFERFGVMFNHLFKPSERLQRQIDYHQNFIGWDYISISFRFTTLLGDFEDCTGAPLPVAERQPLIDRCLAAIADIRRQAPEHRRVLVTADSPTFIEQVRLLPDVYVIPGEIGHIDYQHSDAVNMKTFLDFWLISQAKAVYLYRTGKMYNSAFAKTAAMAGGRPFEVISE